MVKSITLNTAFSYLFVLSSLRKNAARTLLRDRALLAGVFRQLAGAGGQQVSIEELRTAGASNQKTATCIPQRCAMYRYRSMHCGPGGGLLSDIGVSMLSMKHGSERLVCLRG